MNTFRMVIVDDEPMIRKGLRALISRIAPHWVVSGEAANGQDALDLIVQVKPDLVLTDISMPIMNGIELYSELLQMQDTPLVLALSGYTDYVYVRQMLVMGAIDYLTKPVEEPILIEKLKLIEDRILVSFHRKLEENEQNQQLSEFWFHQLISGHNYTPIICEDQLRRLGLPTEGVHFCAMAVYHNTLALTTRDRSSYLYFLLKTCQELVHPHGKVIRAEDGMIMVLHWSPDECELQERLIPFRENLLSFTKAYTQMNIIVGSSPIFQQFRELQVSWEHAKMEIRFQLTSDAETDTIEWMIALQQRQFSRIVNLISDSFPLQQPEIWREQFISRLAILGRYAVQSGLPQQLVFDSSSIKLLGEETSMISRDMWMSKLEDLTKEIVEGTRQTEQQTDSPLIIRIKRYIQTNLNENLTLQTAADHVRMNPSYLSEVFREATGTNFIDYVIQQRMELAKQLIIEDKHKLYEIATMVGYQSSKHFTALFKRVVGMLPSEYKRYVDMIGIH